MGKQHPNLHVPVLHVLNVVLDTRWCLSMMIDTALPSLCSFRVFSNCYCM